MSAAGGCRAASGFTGKLAGRREEPENVVPKGVPLSMDSRVAGLVDRIRCVGVAAEATATARLDLIANPALNVCLIDTTRILARIKIVSAFGLLKIRLTGALRI